MANDSLELLNAIQLLREVLDAYRTEHVYQQQSRIREYLNGYDQRHPAQAEAQAKPKAKAWDALYEKLLSLVATGDQSVLYQWQHMNAFLEEAMGEAATEAQPQPTTVARNHGT